MKLGKRELRRTTFATVVATLAAMGCAAAGAEVFHGIEFPGGASSFADAVVSYDPSFGGGTIPAPTYRNPSQALGTPNFGDAPDPTYVSLGAGGRIVLRFTDNSLTGSGNSNLDLWIFEIGPDVEDTFVDVSKDGINWFAVGKVFGSTSGIDLDAFGFGTSDFFSFVRLTDDINEGATSGTTVGADIDAVGAISTAPPVPPPGRVPEPGTLLLAGLGLALATAIRLARKA
jgi:hypothetical protein